MKFFMMGISLGACIGAACGAFMTPGAGKNIKAIQNMMGKMMR